VVCAAGLRFPLLAAVAARRPLLVTTVTAREADDTVAGLRSSSKAPWDCSVEVGDLGNEDGPMTKDTTPGKPSTRRFRDREDPSEGVWT